MSFVKTKPINGESEIESQTRFFNSSLKILEIITDNDFQCHLISKYYENVINLWENLHFIKDCIENRLGNNDFCNRLPDHVLNTIFKHYVSLIPILHSENFQSETHFSRIVIWTQEYVF